MSKVKAEAKFVGQISDGSLEFIKNGEVSLLNITRS